MELTFFILEMLGTIAFSISGAVAAIDSNMDLLGITMLGITTAVGGGIMRDVTLGVVPPNAFRQPIYVTVAFITIIIFLIGIKIWNHFRPIPEVITSHLKTLFNISDAIGLGAFTMTGANVAINSGHSDNLLLIVFVGFLTGCGGGVLRDIFTTKKPYIFTKHVYGLASIIGALIYFVLRQYLAGNVAMMISAAAIVLIRFVSAKFKLSLPKFKIKPPKS
ncbi:MAG: trimeric intracellular cation channel family protein [Saccharofermentanales bacterium]|jgi:uncharacterized membrane protein YeiH